jgi:hypothetical protein
MGHHPKKIIARPKICALLATGQQKQLHSTRPTGSSEDTTVEVTGSRP